jgi:predicted nucleotidyltransferase component of viral defense system
LEPNRLDKIQREVLRAFFARESRFFLTGGAALVGYYLGHRTTHDLDLFTTEDLMEDGLAALTAATREIGATLEPLRTSPDFRRFLLRRGEEALVVDLVRDSAPQIFPDKPVIGGIRIDPPEEILANKLCTLLSRAEIRDLVDVRALEWKGFSIEHAFPRAMQKDGGLTPGQLAWVLSEVRIGEDASPPGDISASDLREYLEDLRHRLAKMAFPPQ